jgi:predicted DNA-binding protein YlxM (UPF0122 family)
MPTEKSRKLDAVRRDAEAARRAAEKRDETIRKAAGDESLRAIADAAGLSHQRVHQIVKRS